jgi:M6 family metalloprotease-like protein
LLFGTEMSQGNHYWYEVSHGQFQLLPAEENGGTPDDGVVHVKRPEARPTPGDGQLVIEDQGWLQDTLDRLATDGVVDFASFDTDGDGSLVNADLAVHLILNMEFENIALAGAEANILLGDWITTTGHTIAGTGPILERFARGQYQQTAIGVHMHELAHHIFDLDHFVAPTEHGLMGMGAYGGNNHVPTHLLGYNKVKCGFAAVTDLAATATGIELHSAHTGRYNLIRLPLANGTFLYLENREARGYDVSIPFCQGHAGGLFATVTNTHLVPLPISALESEHYLTDYDPLDAEVCHTYAVKGHNDPFGIGGYTIKNVSEAGPTMTFDLEKQAVTPAIEHYKFTYWIRDPDREGYRKWHTQMAVEDGSIDVDVATFVDGDDPTAVFAVRLDAFYNTFDRQSVNSYASWSTSSGYLALEILPMTPGEFPLDDTIVRFFPVQGAPYASTATVDVSHQGFDTSVRFINLPSF